MLKIKLELDNRTYDVESLSYSTYRDNVHLETGGTGSVNISVGIKGNKIDQPFLDWCMGVAGTSHTKDGKISIFNEDNDRMVKTITFQKAYCSSFSESLYVNDSYNNYPLNLNFVAEKIAVKLVTTEKRNPSPEN
jgi:hypothetical protein